MADKDYKAGFYERTVQKITDWVKPSLHKVTEDFADNAVEKYAKDEPKFARMIRFEIHRRGDGAGLTQDVAEPLLWTGVKTLSAIAVATATEYIKEGKFKMIGRVAGAGILLNNAVDLLRLVPRYRAGLQGSLEMAKDRWRSLNTTGVDPFVNRDSREIAAPVIAPEKTVAETAAESWTTKVKAGSQMASAPQL